jgi:hypothetical protein
LSGGGYSMPQLTVWGMIVQSKVDSLEFLYSIEQEIITLDQTAVTAMTSFGAIIRHEYA